MKMLRANNYFTNVSLRYFSEIMAARYSVEQRVFIVESMVKNNYSATTVVRQFRRKFPRASRLTRKTVYNLLNRWRNTGSVKDAPKGGRPRSARNEENIERVRESALRSPKKSSTRRSAELNISGSSVLRILKKDLKLFPYKIQTLQAMSQEDERKRLLFCNTIMELLENGRIEIGNILFTDECHVYLHGFVNTQNFRFWGSRKPNEHFTRPLHSPKVTVWAGICGSRLIGPYFFENNVNSEEYLRMLETFLWPQLEQFNLQHLWYQQDGATSHTANICMLWLKNKFPNRLISKKGDVEWPPRSPDITPPDFFLWGYVKDHVFRNRPQTVEDMKTEIRRAFKNISQETLVKVSQNVELRLRKCVQLNGGHLEHIL